MCTASTICALHVQEESNDRFVDCAIGMIGRCRIGFHEDENKRDAQRHPYYVRVCLRGGLQICKTLGVSRDERIVSNRFDSLSFVAFRFGTGSTARPGGGRVRNLGESK